MAGYERVYTCRNRCGWSTPHTIGFVHPKTGWDDFATLTGEGLSTGEFTTCPQCGGAVEVNTKKIQQAKEAQKMSERKFTEEELIALKNGGQQAVELLVEGILSGEIVPDPESILGLMGVIGNNTPRESSDKARRYRRAVSKLEDQWDQAQQIGR